MESSEERPDGYKEPTAVWLVEYVDPREPMEGSHQIGGFATEAEAEALNERLDREGLFAPLRINMVPIHRRVEDWLWDR